MYDPYTDDRKMEAISQNAILQISKHILDTDRGKDERQEQQPQAIKSLDPPAQPDRTVYEWVEDIEPQVDIFPQAEDDKATAPSPQNLVAETDAQHKPKHTHWMHCIHLSLHRRSHDGSPDRSNGPGDAKTVQGTSELHDRKTAGNGLEEGLPQSVSVCHAGEQKDQTEKPNFFANMRRRSSELWQKMYH
jgi:hypothetical protein